MFVSDPSMFWWVMVPIFFTMLLVSLLQDNLRLLMLSPPVSPAVPPPAAQIRRAHLVARAGRLRIAPSSLPESSFRRRRAFFSGKESGEINALLAEGAKDSVMVKMTLSLIESWGAGAGGTLMKQYALNFVPTILLGVFVNHFFSGFVVGRLPFPLPMAFKSLLHGGIYLPQLDTSYLSSLSWYILSLVGLRSVASLLVFDYAALNRPAPLQSQQSVQGPSATHQPMLASMLMGGLPLPNTTGGPSNEEQQLAAERDALHMVHHDGQVLGGVEARLMRDFP